MKLKKPSFLLITLTAIALSFLLYGNTIGGEFVMDDYSVIADRAALRDISNFFNILFIHHAKKFFYLYKVS